MMRRLLFVVLALLAIAPGLTAAPTLAARSPLPTLLDNVLPLRTDFGDGWILKAPAGVDTTNVASGVYLGPAGSRIAISAARIPEPFSASAQLWQSLVTAWQQRATGLSTSCFFATPLCGDYPITPEEGYRSGDSLPLGVNDAVCYVTQDNPWGEAAGAGLYALDVGIFSQSA